MDNDTDIIDNVPDIIDNVPDIIDNDIKKVECKSITITTPTIKKIKCEKERKYRVETYTWNLDENMLEHNIQFKIIQGLKNNIKDTQSNTNLIIKHIKKKLSSYKQQDIVKQKYNNINFVSYAEVLTLLVMSKLLCHYCSCNVYVLYNYVRECKQWSLDRIDNNIGHNSNNLVISCLECNLKRRRTSKDAFMFTKNMIINKLE